VAEMKFMFVSCLATLGGSARRALRGKAPYVAGSYSESHFVVQRELLDQ